ncbi:glycoside hydrolase family 35 protein [Microbacterium luticocti]|uniref:glycoside hydrolase family 35 protein n=1 Tax=Microbacterium luticocti TaxID=451764 RepID=UPI0004008FB6|nr:glycoside hydrolase family 35 protein [Microbacterium luticocti]
MPATPTLTWADGRLLRDGEPWQLLAGSIHYFRVHPQLWRDRLRRLAEMGMNAVDTYVAWNVHQPHEDRAPDFTGGRDLERFLTTAAEEGLHAVVRPGPYICAEWRNGGLPVWLTGRGTPLRCAEPGYLEPVARWFDELVPRIAALQANAGGPVLAVQVENEFGSYGDDPDYLPAMRRLLADRGITELMYTADGPTRTMTDAGTLPGTLMSLNLGSRVEQARALQHELRPDEPFLCGEFWNGWFDHWGGPHHVRSASSAADTLAEIIADGGSVSVYMAHGGTNFGTGAGANDVDGRLRATTTGYDSDAPIAEDGTLRPKFFALREVLGATAAVRSAPPRFVEPVTAVLRPGRPLTAWTAPGTPVTVPCATDAIGIDSDLVRFDADVLLPPGPIELMLQDVRDRAHIWLDDVFVGSVAGSGTLPVTGHGAHARLTVFAEVLGRINYGPRLGEHKGLVGPVLVDGRRMVQRWRCAPVPLDGLDLDALAGTPGAKPGTGPGTDPGTGPGSDPGSEPGIGPGTGPLFAAAHVPLAEPADAHLSLPGSGRGLVWVNGFLLGRYWDIGPQRTLYAPAPLWRAGSNTVTVLEFRTPGARVHLGDVADVGPEEEFIEEF